MRRTPYRFSFPNTGGKTVSGFTLSAYEHRVKVSALVS